LNPKKIFHYQVGTQQNDAIYVKENYTYMYMADSLNGLKIFNMSNLYNSISPPDNDPVES
jgi:hypothetical protein